MLHEGLPVDLQREIRRHRVVDAQREGMRLLLEAPEHVVCLVAVGHLGDPLRVVDVVAVVEADLGRERRDRADDDGRLKLEEAPVTIAAKRGVPVEAHDAPVVRVEPLPDCFDRPRCRPPGPPRVNRSSKLRGVDIHAAARSPEVLKLPIAR